MRSHASGLVAGLTLLVSAVEAPGVQHPYLLWTQKDLAGIKDRIKTESWAAAEWKRKPAVNSEAAIHDLLAYQLFDDQEAGRKQKEHLLKTLRTKPPLGGAQWVNVLRYDMLHDLLSPTEREEIESIFRNYIQTAIYKNALYDPEEFNDSRNYSRYDAKHYRRQNWLPNIVWPRRVSANLMAAAMGDEALIRQVWNHYGSWRWYFDEYLADSGFYGEEFSKMSAAVGAMLLYCRAVDHLGLSELGYGYTGRFGATMKGHLYSIIRLSYPLVETHTPYPHLRMITTGDLREGGSSRKGGLPTYAFQHGWIMGYLPGETREKRGIHRWQAHGAWGGEVRGNNPQWDGYSGFVAKMMAPFWLEAAEARWPSEGFGWMLSQLREPGQSAYQPSLYFGLEPVVPETQRPPFALSWIAPQRGLAMVRAMEGPGHWRSPAPAVGLRLASPYAHSVNDSFAIAGLIALNRPILANRQTTQGYAQKLSRSIASHNGFMVDRLEPRATDRFHTRHQFNGPYKLLAMDSEAVYPGIDTTRIVVVTAKDVIDIIDLRATDGKLHDYTQMIHALGFPDEEGVRLASPSVHLDGQFAAFADVRQLISQGDSWSVRVVQRSGHTETEKNHLPNEWYARSVGVIINGNAVANDEHRTYVAPTPIADEPDKAPSIEENPEAYEVGGTSLIVQQRQVERATFTTFYQPFDRDYPATRRIRRLETRDANVVAFRLDDTAEETTTYLFVAIRPSDLSKVELSKDLLAHFNDQLFVEVDAEAVRSYGDARKLTVPFRGEKGQFFFNDRLIQPGVSFKNGQMRYEP